MLSKPSLILILFYSISCGNSTVPPINDKTKPQIVNTSTVDENPFAKIKDIPAPENFDRVRSDSNSFAFWLHNVSLKKDKTVYKYDGTQKADQSAQFAVLNISVGNKDLQQCADAVMRLRAEYLFSQKKYNEIIFKDNDHHEYRFSSPYSRENFDRFMEKVFGWCGSASLSKQLNSVNSFSNIQAGDVLIRGGFPGHAVIVMDVVKNNEGKKMYLLAQSYMPAQDIHVLRNPADESLSPWYEVNDNELVPTPEYLFRSSELKRW